MNIFWYGQSCFKIETTSQGKEKINLVIDPFSEKCGLKLPKMEADILLITNKEMTDKSKVSGDYFLIEGVGEYEVKNVFIKGIPSHTENIIYLLKLEEINICHLGFLQDNLKEEELEEIGKVDILMVPIGGNFVLSPQKAGEILNQIEPYVAIPMVFSLPKLKFKLEGVEKFLKIFGIHRLEPLPKLSIKKKDISESEARIVILKP
jgi:L-ascorbate metabolism protein UlaG (beta-lactamase superfamily)